MYNINKSYVGGKSQLMIKLMTTTAQFITYLFVQTVF